MTETATSSLDQSVIECVLAAQDESSAVLAIPETDYRIHVMLKEPLTHETGARLRGRLRASARRIDVIAAGGRYIEPVNGRPRRIQGRVITIDEINDTTTVKAPIPIVCRTNALQRAVSFKPDQMVSFDIEPGVRFEPLT